MYSRHVRLRASHFFQRYRKEWTSGLEGINCASVFRQKGDAQYALLMKLSLGLELVRKHGLRASGKSPHIIDAMAVLESKGFKCI